mgnify:CR=1 FL=1
MDLIIKKEHLNDNNEYIGEIDVSNFDGNIIAEENLGYIKFKSINVSGFILFKAGSGIKAGDGIEAGWGIKAGDGIEAGSGIEAGWGIKAGEGIEAGWGIKAGDDIKAGSGIEAGLSISAQVITTPLRVFAGLCLWRKPTEDEMKIKAKRIEGGGMIAFGEFEQIN